jgi:hypothetical protein
LDRFARFEDYIQRLVEGSFARLFAGRLHPREVAIHLIRAMEDNVQEGEGGPDMAPDVYIVRLNPEDHEHLTTAQPDLPQALANELLEMARIAGLSLLSEPRVKLLADKSVPQKTIAVLAFHETAELYGGTQEMAPQSPPDSPSAPHAYLVEGEGKHTIPLDRPVVTLGRQRDNHIVIDAPHVSRRHAQIRLRFGRYVLYDLGSSGGTAVNGQPVHEYVLAPGDVISLAGYTLLYMEEGQTLANEHTQPMPPASDGR